MALVSLNAEVPEGDETDVVFDAMLVMAKMLPGSATNVFVSDGNGLVERP